jgi:hypothetical protein
VRIIAACAVALLLGSCAPKPPTSAELQTMQTAPKPSSDVAAQAAVKGYFERTLFDPNAAQYRFPLPPVQGRAVVAQMREFGWFMCGDMNGKNRMGGYGGYKPFFVHFSPTIPDKVDDGTVADTDDVVPVLNDWCRGLYGDKWDAR